MDYECSKRGEVMSKNVLELMNEIVNVRSYTEKPIPEQVLTELYEAFLAGPSSISTQSRELLVVENKEKRRLISEATLDPYMSANSYGAQSWLENAPFVGIVLIEERRALARVGKRGLDIAFQEAEAATQNFRIISHAKNIYTACIREFDAQKLRDSLNLPWYIQVSTILTAGYSDEIINIPPRLSIKEAIHIDEWS